MIQLARGISALNVTSGMIAFSLGLLMTLFFMDVMRALGYQ